MLLPRVAAFGVVALAVTAAAVQADPARRGGGRAHRSGQVVAVTPHLAGPAFDTRAFRPAPVVRILPTARYRPVYRPGLSVGISIGSPYRYRYPYRYAYPYAYADRYAYPYQYATPYRYAYPYRHAHSYPGSSVVYATPPSNAFYGGVRLQVTPRDAAVYVDGYYVGSVDDFDGSLQRIGLEPGPHHIEIRAPGYETLAFDVNVRPDETIRYRGDMVPLQP